MIYENEDGLQVELLFMGCQVCEYREVLSRKVHRNVDVIDFEREFKREEIQR